MILARQVVWRLQGQPEISEELGQVDFVRKLSYLLNTQVGTPWEYVVDGKAYTVGEGYSA